MKSLPIVDTVYWSAWCNFIPVSDRKNINEITINSFK